MVMWTGESYCHRHAALGTQQRRIRPAAPRVYTTGDILRDRKGIAPWQEQREPGWAPFGWLHEPSGARCPKADGQSV